MAAHVHLKNEFMEDGKCHNLMTWLKWCLVGLFSASNVLFYFRWGKIKLEVHVSMSETVNNGQWHQISIETDIHNIRCMVDMREKIVEIPDGVPRVAAFTGVLYVGGTSEQ